MFQKMSQTASNLKTWSNFVTKCVYSGTRGNQYQYTKMLRLVYIMYKSILAVKRLR